jgi:hypothetical protein
LSVYLPHVVLLLAAASSPGLTVWTVSGFTQSRASGIGAMSRGGVSVSTVSREFGCVSPRRTTKPSTTPQRRAARRSGPP